MSVTSTTSNALRCVLPGRRPQQPARMWHCPAGWSLGGDPVLSAASCSRFSWGGLVNGPLGLVTPVWTRSSTLLGHLVARHEVQVINFLSGISRVHVGVRVQPGLPEVEVDVIACLVPSTKVKLPEVEFHVGGPTLPCRGRHRPRVAADLGVGAHQTRHVVVDMTVHRGGLHLAAKLVEATRDQDHERLFSPLPLLRQGVMHPGKQRVFITRLFQVGGHGFHSDGVRFLVAGRA